MPTAAIPVASRCWRWLEKKMIKIRYVFLVVLTVFSVFVAGCSKQEPTPEVAAAPGGDESSGGPRGELQGINRLALATLRLEGTENAVTAGQANELLPLWTILQSGSLQGQAETDAVLKQIEAKFTEAQQAAIDEMSLTFQDIGTWMQEQGIEMPTPGPDASSGESSGRPAMQGGPGQGGPGAFQNMSEEERTRLREEFQNMTQEQRATRIASLSTEAQGAQRPEGEGQGGFPGSPGARGGFGGRVGGENYLLGPLIELLTERASE